MNKYIKTIARWVYGLSIGIFGIHHFVNAPDLLQYVPEFIPGGLFWVYFTGIAFLMACISILSGFIQGSVAICWH